jgi:GDPmannose 4,6-dehydratase
MFGDQTQGITEESIPVPKSPYALSKLAAHQIAGIYRNVSGLHISCGILFNHESPLRPEKFVSRRVSLQVAKIFLGLSSELLIGDLSAYRDWGWAPDYVQAMELIINNPNPEDYVVSSGIGYTVGDMVRLAFESVELHDWQKYVRLESGFFRPNDISGTVGNSKKILDHLGWKSSLGLNHIMDILVKFDIAVLCGEPEHMAARRFLHDPSLG